MRLFIAIALPDRLKQELAKVQELLRSSGADAGWTRPEGVHLTLKFLGETPDAQVAEITAALARSAAGTGRFALAAAGVGAFPSPLRPRVVWIGIHGGGGRLEALQGSIEASLEGLGFAREERQFIPHLTLGRIRRLRSPAAWRRALDAVKDVRYPEFEVAAVNLMQSELRPSGAVYREIAQVEL